MKLTYGSVCSGIEAATVAWHPLGWLPCFFSEIDRFPRAVLEHHYPTVPLHGDFTTINAGDYADIAVLVGGTPCQSFSVAGLRGGLDDERGNLALEYLRLAQRLRPRWLVWENVPGVLSSNGGRDFGVILGGMVELGYGWAYRVLDSQHFGVPQRRRRVFVVGHLGDRRAAAAVLFERACLSGHPPPRRHAGTRAAAGAAFGIDSDCIDRSGEGAGGSAGERSGLGITEECSPALRAKRANAVAYSGVAHGINAHPGPHRRLDASAETFIPVDLTNTRCGGDVAGTLGTEQAHGNKGQFVAYRTSPNCGAWETGDRTDALTTGTDRTSMVVAIPILEPGRRSGRSTDDTRIGLGVGEDGDPMFTLPAERPHGVGTATGVRRLTPRECERLQGFPDDYTLIPWRGGEAADGPRYKALGNSMAVPCMVWLGRRISMVEDIINGAQDRA